MRDRVFPNRKKKRRIYDPWVEIEDGGKKITKRMSKLTNDEADSLLIEVFCRKLKEIVCPNCGAKMDMEDDNGTDAIR